MSQPAETHKNWEDARGIWTYVKDFWKRANMQCSICLFFFFFRDGNRKPQATPEVFPLLLFENSFAAPDPVGCICADSPPVRCHQESDRRRPLSSQDIDAAGPCDCADSPLFARSVNHIQRGGIQPGELSSSRHAAQTNHSPSGGEYDGVGA